MGKIELVGKKYNRLTVLEFDSMTRPGDPKYLCECECGKKKVIRGYSIKSGHTKSCGCLNKEILHTQKNRLIHGKSKTRLHNIWWGIIERCEDKRNTAYNRYGGRGIKIYPDWREDFRAFEKWSLENGYKPNLTIDRIDNDGDYIPGNCRWTTMKQQGNNKSNNHRITIDGMTKTLTQWTEYSGLNRSTIHRRLKRGIVGRDLIQKKAIR